MNRNSLRRLENNFIVACGTGSLRKSCGRNFELRSADGHVHILRYAKNDRS